MANKPEWLTTAPNPQSRNTGFDAGQRGWKLHCVEIINNSFSQSKEQRALCGLLPAHGWSLDLFIEDRCSRCETAAEGNLKLYGVEIPESEVRYPSLKRK